MDKAPGAIGSVAGLSKHARQGAVEVRRSWLSQALKEDPGSLSLSEVEAMSRVNRELGSLVSLETGDDIRATLSKLNEPVGRHPGFPGGDIAAMKRGDTPSPLVKGHWSKPFVDAVGGKALTSGSVVVPSLLSGVVPIPDRPTSLAQVIPSTTLQGTNTFGYLQETVRDHKAAEVASGGLKPKSTYTVTRVDDQVRTIATVSDPIDRFTLEDAAMLTQYIEGSLSQSVLLRLDSQIANSDGVAPNIGKGLTVVPGKQAQAFSTSVLQTARKALSLLYAEEIYDGMVFVVNPAQWELIELQQLSTGAYVMAGGNNGVPVADTVNQRLWGKPVIISSAVAPGGSAILFCPGYTHLWERDTVQIDWSEAPVGSSAGNAGFLSNEITFRAEGRWGFGCLKPASIVIWQTA